MPSLVAFLRYHYLLGTERSPLLLYPDRDEHFMRTVSVSSTLARREPISDGHVGIGDSRQPDACFTQRARTIAEAPEPQA